MPQKVREGFLIGFVRILSLAGASGWRQVTPTWDEITRSVGGSMPDEGGSLRALPKVSSDALFHQRALDFQGAGNNSTFKGGRRRMKGPTRRDDGWCNYSS
jgi:hypothetical protein